MTDSKSEITGLAFDPIPNYVAACSESGVVQLYALDSMGLVFSISNRKNVTLKAIAFGQMKEGNRNVVVFEHHEGKV